VDYKVYSVRAADKQPLLDFILTALEREGCSIIRHSPADEAPFRISFETRGGERLGIVCYAFLANTKLTKNRPADEHRFQVKYGTKDGRLHRIWQDPYGLYTTLFVGINPDLGFFVGADPEIHNPTKFFISVEFKQEHASVILAAGWHAWERERRKYDNEPAEVLVGGTQPSFLQYVRFERAAQGLDQGHRQLLAEKMILPAPKMAPVATSPLPVPPPETMHALAREFEMSETQVLDLIASARRLKMAVRGWVAEEHLVKTLERVEGVTECRRLDDEGGPDVSLRYEKSRLLTLQCKNVLRQTAADGTPRMDFQKTRSSKGDPCSRYYRPNDFDLIAACLHAVSERWEYRYARPGVLDPHRTCPGRLSNNVRLDGRWGADAAMVLRAAADAA
jgi:hypothetical protein